MVITVALVKETVPGERRVALNPGAVAKLIDRGVRVFIERDAGLAARHPDDEYTGAEFADDVERDRSGRHPGQGAAADLEEINAEFPRTDVNDVVNPAARSNKDSPIYGMPILDVNKAHQCLVIKRGRGTGFSGIENELFFADNTSMVYGDAQKVAADLIAGVKTL